MNGLTRLCRRIALSSVLLGAVAGCEAATSPIPPAAVSGPLLSGGSDPADSPLFVGMYGPSLVSSDWVDPYPAEYSVTLVDNGRTSQYEFFWYVSMCSGPDDLYCWADHPFQPYQSGVELRSITVPIDHYLRVVRVYVEAREYSAPNYRTGISEVQRTRAPGYGMGGGGGGYNFVCLGGTVFDWDNGGKYKRDYCTGLKVWQ